MTGKWAGKGSRHERGYGAAWDRLRKQVLERDRWLCQACLRNGQITALGVRARDHAVDHVVPKAYGGTDDPENLEALCRDCHKSKSSVELGYKPKQTIGADGWIATEKLKRFGYSIPDGIKPSAIPVTLVCGPPASGKTTYIAQHAAPGDIVIDFDVYLKQIGAKKWTTDPDAVRKAFRIRDAYLRALETARSGRAWVIAMAPSARERKAWAEALGDLRVVLLDVPAETCAARLGQDADRAHAKARMLAAIRSWWLDYEPTP
jgi:predicted kinase